MKWMQKTLAVMMFALFAMMATPAHAADPLPGTDPNSIFKMWKPPSLEDNLWKGRFNYAKNTYERIKRFYAKKFDGLSEKNRRCLWAKILFTQASLYYDLTKGKNGNAVAQGEGREIYEHFQRILRQSCSDKDDDGFKLFEEYKENMGDAASKWDLVRKVAKDSPIPAEIKPGVDEAIRNEDADTAIKLFMLGIFVGCAEAGPVGCAVP